VPVATLLDRLLDAATPKLHVAGTHRACAPATTVARLRPRLVDYGITRVADVTGLDRIGIPVVMVVRPNGWSLSVAQGKGLDLDAARASGIMESIEAHCAERGRPVIRIAKYAALARDDRAVDPENLPLRRSPQMSVHKAIPWALGYDLFRDCPAWVPFERVHLDLRVPDGPGMGVFVQDSNGLASGNTLAEAVLHGLYELIERDAWALDERRRLGSDAAAEVEIGGRDALVDEALRRCRSAGVAVTMREITSDVGVPVFEATLADVVPGPLPSPPPTRGFGCHLDAAVAALRAITEAAQGRVTLIAGSRDDLLPEYESDPFVTALRQQPRADVPRYLTTLADLSTRTLEGDLATVLSCLGDRGVDEVVAVDLSPGNDSAAVARVVVPALEAVPEGAHYRPGPRALAVMP
jgi:YcaO-like protein with predicted kinase domain